MPCGADPTCPSDITLQFQRDLGNNHFLYLTPTGASCSGCLNPITTKWNAAVMQCVTLTSTTGVGNTITSAAVLTTNPPAATSSVISSGPKGYGASCLVAAECLPFLTCLAGSCACGTGQFTCGNTACCNLDTLCAAGVCVANTSVSAKVTSSSLASILTSTITSTVDQQNSQAGGVNSNDNGGGFPIYGIIVAAVGGAILLVGIAAIVFCLARRTKKDSKQGSQQLYYSGTQTKTPMVQPISPMLLPQPQYGSPHTSASASPIFPSGPPPGAVFKNQSVAGSSGASSSGSTIDSLVVSNSPGGVLAPREAFGAVVAPPVPFIQGLPNPPLQEVE
ncbi:hypothetical protein M427DRAFT_171523 [Gonapodya prolifera JEL478]|uniref:Uncharacterized protein n=1 Tax=Gonapodya prolifera (strain JEL478) TaxID=1344416 RepID=A0A139B056_GONPJ|nr:hypothetical protein M427DRAFT_171523 [Gonapodya prolifera JEL478]|eukprot:KXS22382.1 hypothetical protein M427DRAFT_171523 [Gonapodya prolifera JEL478]